MGVSRADAEAGWEIYRDSDFSLKRAEVNDELHRRGLPPVSDRTFRHYGKLRRFGYERYLPINQLDVHTLRDPIWDKSLRSRYLMYDVHEDGKLFVPSAEGVVVLDATVISLSDGEAVLRVASTYVNLLTEHAKRTEAPVDVLFAQTGELRLAELDKVTLDRRRRQVVAKVFFSQVESIGSLLGRDPLPAGRVRITVGAKGDAVLLAGTAQQVYWLFQAVEAMRLAASEMLRSVDAQGLRSIPPAEVKRLSVASPLEAVLLGAVPFIGGLVYVAQRVVTMRKEWFEGDKSHQEARRLKWEQDRREHLAAGVDPDVVRGILRDEIRRALGPHLADEPDGATASRIDALVLGQATPALGELAEVSDGDLSVAQDDEDAA